MLPEYVVKQLVEICLHEDPEPIKVRSFYYVVFDWHRDLKTDIQGKNFADSLLTHPPDSVNLTTCGRQLLQYLMDIHHPYYRDAYNQLLFTVNDPVGGIYHFGSPSPVIITFPTT